MANEQGNGAAASTSTKKKQVEKIKQQDVSCADDGTVSIKTEFVNGVVLEHSFPPSNATYSKAAGFGYARTLSNTGAGVTDLGDFVEAYTRRAEILVAGKWSGDKAASVPGAALVIRAIARMEYKDDQAAAREAVKALAADAAGSGADQDKLDAAWASTIKTLAEWQAVIDVVTELKREDAAKAPEKQAAALSLFNKLRAQASPAEEGEEAAE